MPLGPLTTTFTPPADCVASSALYWVRTSSTFYWLHGQPAQSSCFPDNYSPYQDQYYSPGICPAGYTRACESVSTSGGVATTRATCCPQGNYGCAPTSSSYSYAWGPTLGCQSVYRVDTTTSFTTVDGTPRGGETVGTPVSLRAPGTIMAYAVVIRNAETATTATEPITSGSGNSLQRPNSLIASETGAASSTPTTTEAQPSDSSSDGNGSGINGGAAAGIAIGAAVGILLLGGAIVSLFWSRWVRKKRRAAEERAQADAIDSGTGMWWTKSPTQQRQQAVQINWPPTELAHEREPKEVSAESQVPVEKDGRGLGWR
ncbi:hypothetical protein F5Y04DRAFT_277364 [Hypomontagnella monticulosa]|nr:hypothetical protein F5Y04DRAFT_277364 [Hypomontagnella monticulosa]